MEYATRHLYFPYTHEKALHNYFIPCLNLRKIYAGISENLGNASNPLLRNLIQKRFMKILENLSGIEVENLWHSSETFGKLRKQFKSAFQCFYDFLKFSEIFGNLRKMTGGDRKCS